MSRDIYGYCSSKGGYWWAEVPTAELLTQNVNNAKVEKLCVSLMILWQLASVPPAPGIYLAGF